MVLQLQSTLTCHTKPLHAIAATKLEYRKPLAENFVLCIESIMKTSMPFNSFDFEDAVLQRLTEDWQASRLSPLIPRKIVSPLNAGVA
jgi:hypothetical protein